MTEPTQWQDPQAPAEAGLLSRLEVIEAQPLAQRAEGFDQLAEELLVTLQRSDNDSV